MDKNRIANIVLNGRIDGTAKRGRPRTTWMKSVLARYDRGPQALMRIAHERQRWSLLSTNVRAHVDLQ